MRKLLIPVMIFIIGILPLSAQITAGPFKFSGFGTLAATKSSEKNGDFISNYAQAKGPGFSNSVDFGEASRVGFQVDWAIGGGFSAVLQGITERRYDNTFNPYINMGHLKWQAAGNLALRAGRIPYSAYLISDYQKVGYSQPWVRPPVEVYQFNPINYIDGGDATWQFNTGSVAWTGQFLAGQVAVKLSPSSLAVSATPAGQKPPDSEWRSKDVYAVGITANIGHTTIRGYHLQMKGNFYDLGFDNPRGPFALLRSPYLPTPAGPVANPYYNPALADKYQIRQDKVIYQSLGLNYDPGKWFFMTEITKKSGDEDILLSFVSGYATAGIRLGNWTPYLTGGWKHTTSDITNTNPVINAIISALDRGQSSYSAGVRWECYTNVALKAQYDHITNVSKGWGALINTTPSFQPGKSYNLATLALDFVF